MSQPTKEEIHDLFIMVRDGDMTLDEADTHAEAIIMELVGRDEALDAGAVHGFPDKWGAADKVAAKKTWVHSRNHLRRGIRAKYRG